MPDQGRARALPAGGLLLVLLLASALAPAASALDVSTKAIKVVGSSVYPENVQSYSGQVTSFSGEFNGEGIGIAILDTGVDDGHPTFEGAFVAGATIQQGCTSGLANCMQDRNPLTDQAINPDDTDGHGTHVASIALGRGGPGVGPRGVAPGARLVDVKIASDIAGLSLNGVASGIRWVVDYNEGTTFYGPPPYPVKVISISYASNVPVRDKDRDEAMKAVQEAWDAGILVVAAAGNCGPDAGATACPGFNKANGNMITSPGAAPEAITVGAIDDQTTLDNPDSVTRNGDEVAGYSSRGPNPGASGDDPETFRFWRKPDVVAPGSRIAAACASIAPASQQGSGMNCQKSGTSMATPHVAGIAAILFHAGGATAAGGLSSSQVKELILSTAEDWTAVPGWDATSGYGYVDAYAALVKAVNRPPRASFVYRPVVPEAGQQVEFDASVTTDPDDQDTIERFLWDFGDGSPVVEVAGEVKRVEHTYEAQGAYTVRLTAYDSRGSSDTDVQTVQVNPPPPPDRGNPPVPDIKFWPKRPRAGDEVHFDAANSTDPDGDRIRQYHWDFDYESGDFDAALRNFDEPTATWTFPEQRIVRVALRVVDERGLAGLTWVAISVAPPPPGPPVVQITNPQESDRIQAGPVLAAWVVTEHPADAFTIFIDGVEELTVGARQVRLDLPVGAHTMRVEAVGPGGFSRATVNFTAVTGEALAAAATGACSTHTHADGSREEHCPDAATSNRCELVTHSDGRTETLCGRALDAFKAARTAKVSTSDEPDETPVDPFAALVAAVIAALLARRRRRTA